MVFVCIKCAVIIILHDWVLVPSTVCASKILIFIRAFEGESILALGFTYPLFFALQSC